MQNCRNNGNINWADIHHQEPCFPQLLPLLNQYPGSSTPGHLGEVVLILRLVEVKELAKHHLESQLPPSFTWQPSLMLGFCLTHTEDLSSGSGREPVKVPVKVPVNINAYV